MKIAHLLPAFSAFSGIARAVYNLAKEQRIKGSEVTIFALEADTNPPEGVALEVVEMPRYPILQKIYRVIMPLDIYRALKWVPRLKDFDVIYGHFYPMIWLAYLAKRFYNVKFVYYDHGIPQPKLLSSFVERTYIRVITALTNWTVKRADGAVCVSQYLQQELNKKTGLATEVVYHKIDGSRFRRGLDGLRVRDKHNLGNRPLILYVGRISPHKGCHLLIGAFSLVRRQFTEARLLMVGKYTFPLADYYNKLTEMGGDSVIFTGYVADEELPFYYAACDVYATGTMWEGFNFPLVEAQACGKPVVAFNLGPHPEVVQDGVTGFLVPPEDTNALAEAMVRLLQDDKLREQMGENAYKMARERFSVI